MKYVKTFEDQINEGLFSFLSGIFKNGAQKRQLDKLAKKLTETRVEIGRLKIEGDSIEDFKNELEDESNSYGLSSSFRSEDTDEGNPHEIKIQTLETLEEDLIAAMDAIGNENETLEKYVNKVKIESRLEASEKLIRLADGETAKILTKLKRKDAQNIKKADKELYDMQESMLKDMKLEERYINKSDYAMKHIKLFEQFASEQDNLKESTNRWYSKLLSLGKIKVDVEWADEIDLSKDLKDFTSKHFPGVDYKYLAIVFKNNAKDEWEKVKKILGGVVGESDNDGEFVIVNAQTA